MKTQFDPSPEETYIDGSDLGRRWNCHEKTAGRRAKRLGIVALLFTNRPTYPMSEILRVEREALQRFAERKTAYPLQCVKEPEDSKPAVGRSPAGRKRRARRQQLAANEL
jgi:hypothetical protein